MKTNWKEFCQRIIDTNGNPSTKDAEETGIPFGLWFDLAVRTKNKEKLIENAKNIIKEIERREYEK